MILFGDYHTHTIYSHGTGTVLENAKVAADKGIKEIAISDHGFNHKAHGIKRKQLPSMHGDIEIAKKQTGVTILRGVEANFIDREGAIDVSVSDYSRFDVILCGYHRFVKAKTIRDQFGFILPSNMALLPSKSKIDKNTSVVLKAIEKNRIDILTHLNSILKVDVLKVARFARDAGTYIELNERRMLFKPEELATMFDDKVSFIVSSDAHASVKVGECNKVLNIVRKLDLPLINIANINKYPIFKKFREGENIK